HKAVGRSQEDRVPRVTITIRIAPNRDDYRGAIEVRIREVRRAPGNADRRDGRLAWNDVELIKPERFKVLQTVTETDRILCCAVIDHVSRRRKEQPMDWIHGPIGAVNLARV